MNQQNIGNVTVRLADVERVIREYFMLSHEDFKKLHPLITDNDMHGKVSELIVKALAFEGVVI